MSKKISDGVIIIGSIMLIYSIICLIMYRYELPHAFTPFGLAYTTLLRIPTLDGVIYFISSISILAFKNWARKLAIIYSAAMLPFALLAGLEAIINPVTFIPGNFFVLHPDVFGITRSTPESTLTLLTVKGIILIPLIMYGLIIYFFTRPEVKRQFK